MFKGESRNEEDIIMYKNSKLFSVLSYITWIGFVVSFLLRDRNDTLVRRHLNQALIIHLISTVGSFLTRAGGILATAGGIIGIACLVLFIMGIVRAFRMSEEPLPYIGEFTLFD